MANERTSRFSDFVPIVTFRDTPVQVIGCGSVGRAVGLLLAQMGARWVHLWDDDVVEDSNLGTQGWNHRHLGRPKVMALKEDMAQKWPRTQRTRLHYLPHRERVGHLPIDYWDHGDVVPTATFLCVDSIPARGAVLDTLLASLRYTHLLDARVLGETGRVLTLPLWNETQVTYYRGTLPPEEHVVQGACTSKMTPYGAQMAACLMIRNYAQILQYVTPPRDVFFNLAEPHLGLTPEENPTEDPTDNPTDTPADTPEGQRPVALRGVGLGHDDNPVADPDTDSLPF